MADWNPTVLSLLIIAPEPPAFLFFDGEFLTSSHRKFYCITI